MDWLFSIIRIAGVSFPVASSLVQLQAEIDSKSLSIRVRRLEDPISCIHEDVPKVGKIIFEALSVQNRLDLHLEPESYTKYSRPLAMLESCGYLIGNHTIGHRYYAGISIRDPSFVMYLCALFEDPERMKQLISIVDSCKPGQWLNGISLASEYFLPEPTVESVFKIYESKGLGHLSREVGTINYLGHA
jgi:hypothetical protein